MGSAEFIDWLAYSRIERFGPQMDDLRLGTIAAAIYNVNRDIKARRDPFGPKDVFGWMAPEKPARPILLKDKDKQSALINAMLFGIAPTTGEAPPTKPARSQSIKKRGR